jgi:hypothetical protein
LNQFGSDPRQNLLPDPERLREVRIGRKDEVVETGLDILDKPVGDLLMAPEDMNAGRVGSCPC